MTVKHELTAFPIDAKITHVGPSKVVKILLDVKVLKWSAHTDNVKITQTYGDLDAKLLKTVLVMLSSVIKDTVGVLPVLKANKSMENLIMTQLPLLILLLLLLLLL